VPLLGFGARPELIPAMALLVRPWRRKGNALLVSS
jgi:hypothetical protein